MDLKEYLMDLHIHSPIFKDDYFQQDVDLIDIIEEAINHNLKIIAITDHNSINGYRKIIEEIQNLKFLGQTLKEANVPFDHSPEIKIKNERYKKYQHFLFSDNILVLPGVEINVGGIHILGIFEKGNDIDECLKICERVSAMLIEIGIKPDEQNPSGYSRRDIIEVCQKIKDNGGIVIAAHTMSKDGLHNKIEKGRQLQDTVKHFMALEVKNYKEWKEISELHSGERQGYPYLPCIMSSDAHFIKRDEDNPNHKDRATFEDKRITRICLQALSFSELRQTFLKETSTSDRIQIGGDDVKYLNSLIESPPHNVIFMASIPSDKESETRLCRYVSSFANTCDGTVIIGAEKTKDSKSYPKFINVNIQETIEKLKVLFKNSISPSPEIDFTTLKIDRNNLLQLSIVKCKDERPYVLRETGSVWMFDNNGDIYPASHADILDLAKPIFEDEFLDLFDLQKEQMIIQQNQEIQSLKAKNQYLENQKSKLVNENTSLMELIAQKEEELYIAQDSIAQLPLPNSGIEVFESKEDAGKWTHALRDLRNDKKYTNRTWENTTGIHHYAISEHETFRIEEVVPRTAMESRVVPGIWINANYHAEKWKYNFYDFRGRKKKIYYSVIGDSLEGIWLDIVNDFQSRLSESNNIIAS